MVGHWLVMKQQGAALGAALTTTAFSFYLYKFCKSWARHAPMIALVTERRKELEEVMGMEFPFPAWWWAPWIALRAFVKALREHRHLHFLCDVHDVANGTFLVPLPMQATYIVTNVVENVEHVLKNNFDNYVKGDTFFIPRMMDLLGHGIFNADGSGWYYQRKTASRMFTQKKLTTHIWRVVEKNCGKVVELLLRTPKESTVDLFNIMNRFTLDTIGEIGFARDIGALENADSPFLKSFDRAQQISFLRLIMPLWRLRRLLRFGEERDSAHHFKLLSDYSLETVRELKANLNTERGDSFVGLFMQEAEKSGTRYDEVFMKDMVLNFLIAGRDTTAQSLSWTFYLLLGHPDVENKVLEEIAEVCGDRTLLYEDLSRLTFLQAVVNESLRLYPSVSLDAKKSLCKDTLLDGTFVEKDDVVVYNIFAMGRSKRIWGDDADEFKPERWLGKDFPSLYAYPVFNAGPRECLGRRLAWVEMKTCLVHILRSVKLKLAVRRDAVHYDAQLTLGMSSGLPCMVEAR